MHLFHNWDTIAESPKWKAQQCKKCGKIKWIEKFQGGYSPRPTLFGEPEINLTPPRSGTSVSFPKHAQATLCNTDNWIE